jgi:hypothetical protein
MEFRKKKLWTEFCDLMITKHLKTLKDIYERYSGKESLPSTPKFMSISEFVELVTAS